jgi:serine/threonine-protein kinase
MSLPTNSKRKIFDGRYEIISIVGRGADSVVYHARHITGTAQEVAIKVLVNRGGSTTLTDKLRKEALTLVSCRHKYVVRLDDFHSIKDLCYLSMEYAPQGDLLKYMATMGNKLPAEQVALFLRQALEALDFIHATGVVHRDIKPENILVIHDKEIRLADFGLALLPGDEVALEELRTAVGTFDYLAPEVLEGLRYDTQSDLYSLGVCFYELATGTHPFRDIPLAKQQETRKDGAIRPVLELAPALAPQAAAVISTLMRFSSSDRFQTASDALKALANKDFVATVAREASATPPAGMQGAGSSSTRAESRAHEIIPIPGQGSAAADVHVATATATSAVAAVASATAVTARGDLQQPANSDTPSSSSRAAQPTEKIDLERVKAIIARDTQRKPNSTSSNLVKDEIKEGQSTASAQPITASRPRATEKRSPAPTKGVRSGSVFDYFYGLPTIAKSVAVALLSAVVTVGGLLAWHSLSGSFTPSDQNALQVSSAQSDSANIDESSSTTDQELVADVGSDGLHTLPEGLYTGAVRGLLPVGDIPLALISRPDVEGVILALGLDGWVPSTANTAEKDNDPQSTTFRSNGLILQFNRELRTDKITGTVTDVVTGETGTWSVEKTS